MKGLSVSCAQVDITPSEPVLLSGYANRQGFSTSVHRSLSSRCIVFKAGSETVCLITYDLVDILPELTQEIIHRISQQTGLPADHIFVHAIHTHSAPIMEYGASAQNDRYIAWAMDRIAANGVKTITRYDVFSVVLTAQRERAVRYFRQSPAHRSTHRHCRQDRQRRWAQRPGGECSATAEWPGEAGCDALHVRVPSCGPRL